MVQLAKPANAPGNDEKMSFTTLENGWYNVLILDSCEKEYSDGQPGKRTEYKTQVYDGKDQGKILFIGFNLEHTNPKTEESAHKAHNSFVEKCGKGAVYYTDELHNCLVRVRVVTNKDGYNDVKEYDYYQKNTVNQQGYPSIQYAPPQSKYGTPNTSAEQFMLNQTQFNPNPNPAPDRNYVSYGSGPAQNTVPPIQNPPDRIPDFVKAHMNAQQHQDQLIQGSQYPPQTGRYPGQSAPQNRQNSQYNPTEQKNYQHGNDQDNVPLHMRNR